MSSIASKPQDSLLVRIAQGDGSAVGDVLDRYSGLVWSMARRWISDAATAEDAVQEIFIEVWKSAARFDPSKASDSTFIATIARRRLIDRQRRTGRRPVSELIDEGSFPVEDDGLSGVDDKDEARWAASAIGELEPKQRNILLMSVVQGLTHTEIADSTGVPLGTVKSHIRRGLAKVSDKLSQSREGEGQ